MAAATISLLCVWGPWEVLVPYLVKNELGGSAAALGFVFAAGGAGAVPRRWRRGSATCLDAHHAALLGMGDLGVRDDRIRRLTRIWHAMLASFVMESGITVLLVMWFTVGSTVGALVHPGRV